MCGTPDILEDKAVGVFRVEIPLVLFTSPFIEQVKHSKEWHSLEVNSPIAEIDHSPPRSLRIGIYSDKERLLLSWITHSLHELGLRSARGVLDLPRLDFWIPSTVVLASVEIDIGGYLLSYS